MQLAHAGQNAGAESFLHQFALLSMLLGENSSALSYAQQQKIGDEELITVCQVAVRGRKHGGG